MFNIVLHEPEIPPNTGNIARTCVGTDCCLHLIEPLGFDLSEKSLRRAGLDYWQHLKWERHGGWQDWWETVPNPSRVFLFTTKTDRTLYDVSFQEGDYLVFGSETRGLPESRLEEFTQQTVTLPMTSHIRSLNLSNTVAVAAYEALRQVNHGHMARPKL